MTNCRNCGAVLKGNICEYCGTDYSNESIKNKYEGAIEVKKEYIPHFKPCRDANMNLVRDEFPKTRTTIIYED